MLFTHSNSIANHGWMQSYYNICGNASLEQAEVVVLTDIYNDEENAHNNVEFVNQIWQGHLVLVEDIPFGQQIQPQQHRFSKGISKKITINGWDHPEFKAHAEKLDAREESIVVLARRIQADLQEKCWGLFNSECEAFASLLEFGSENTQQKKKEIRQLLQNGAQDAFVLSVNEAIADVRRDHQKLVYELYASLWQSRLDYLIDAINYGIKLYKKVIVLVSGSFVIPNPNLKAREFDLTKITSYLGQQKFAILNAKHSFLSIVNQPELWAQPPKNLTASSYTSSVNIIAPQPRRASASSRYYESKEIDSEKRMSMQLETMNGVQEKISALFICRQPLRVIVEEDESETTSSSSKESSHSGLNLAKTKKENPQ
jgi:hypothetical protein